MNILEHTRLKICGIKSIDEAEAVVGFDVDYLGVIFAKSKRAVDIQTARSISRITHKFGKKQVGVFAGLGQDYYCGFKPGFQSDCEIMEICEFASLDVVQIYGPISQNLYINLKDLGAKVWKVLSLKDELLSTNEPCDMILYDCSGENLGGNGTAFDWNLLKALKPFSFGMAGGIGHHNILEALKFKPILIDINSKVEDENLMKNSQKIAKIFEILKSRLP